MNYISVISFISAGHKNNNELRRIARIARSDLAYFDFSLFTFHFAEGDWKSTPCSLLWEVVRQVHGLMGISPRT